ncbi:helix-turn-helix domain-containing protein [Leifsonia shinshuensis]|uniref:Helix-turn-helix transcriptional regulator n=1 Tax=Leifsonia shinshuensis TaxID=150026 RepID=A0A7G6Y754_9MICO|nr:helix-turn-helix transcriptional regulator [Leifsonia shinshuensis]QNE34319.1 helix-turn-helix transcriptional regulator [Leifsonia shinshuensis]
MKREIHYEWHTRELMARNHFRRGKDLIEPLRERGITLSPTQVWRLVDQTPERISLQVLVALADIFGVEVSEVITYTAADKSTQRRKTAQSGALPDIHGYRPVRARIVDEDDDDGA